MSQLISRILDHLSEFLAARKGLLPLLGLGLILLNLIIQFLSDGWVAQTHLLLHLGLIIAILGFMLARAL
ncbi:hypothetical protein SE15_07770 [Thermanaerothrix daxensis]|uniref:Uncharacterized protein n=1 Tax=Thermanaerothrix daxensis TaxID=869279 RepID=A0A0P6Y287_9CHLR|nr:hypothetical protein [Thermanaerothrix daxensis]KPL83151.1 hypothetical protein SE15_07770 [Thermanaerothrix daxensis]